MKTKCAKLNQVGTFLIFAGPATLAFLSVVIIPFIYGVYLTFTSWDGLSKEKPFVGLANYRAMAADVPFWQSLGLTLLYVLFSVILVNLIGFLLALLVTGKLRGKSFFRAGFFTPNLIGGIILGYIWQFIFNRILVYIGSISGLPIFQKSWLSSFSGAFAALVIVTVWQLSGYMMLIYIAGLTGVPTDVREAAKIDGCTEGQMTRYIVLPLMRSSFTICLFLTITRCFMVYDVNLSLTEGGPYGSTILAAMYVFQKAFSAKQYGVGQTEAIVLFLFTAVIAVTQAVLGKRKEVAA
ncbi:MAG: sugar ABC transporter permease [Oscillospiraceae bacterium]|nr:sugar ABC transporter permease [Oscillospiraceae bacterium]MDD4368883.1 sugar ABC transporter permease [Oscillospiraceae bacterium]